MFPSAATLGMEYGNHPPRRRDNCAAPWPPVTRSIMFAHGAFAQPKKPTSAGQLSASAFAGMLGARRLYFS